MALAILVDQLVPMLLLNRLAQSVLVVLAARLYLVVLVDLVPQIHLVALVALECLHQLDLVGPLHLAVLWAL